MIGCMLISVFSSVSAQHWYNLPADTKTRWSSFENPTAGKGEGGKENKGAKGHAFDSIKAGETKVLLNYKGTGIINRIWMTISDRSPEMLRSLRLDMYWDGADNPAVSVPLGDFFGVGLGRKVAFASEPFSDPEGRSFNCFVPMPFRSAARITVTNESSKTLKAIFYDINFILVDEHPEDVLYFHAYWNRDMKTTLGKDYVILPEVKGAGRFFGTNIGIFTDSTYQTSWWGEGEVKMYIDGDSDFPTLIGTGTEDYVGTAYGQGTYDHDYQGSLIINDDLGAYAFYRYHIPDPVYFYQDIFVTIQQIGGWPKEQVVSLVKNGANLVPISVHKPDGEFVQLLENESALKITDPDFPEGWVNFYRQDDVSSTAYFYLNKPENNLPPLASLEVRVAELK